MFHALYERYKMEWAFTDMFTARIYNVLSNVYQKVEEGQKPRAIPMVESMIFKSEFKEIPKSAVIRTVHGDVTHEELEAAAARASIAGEAIKLRNLRG
jgi:hypothetical protein